MMITATLTLLTALGCGPPAATRPDPPATAPARPQQAPDTDAADDLLRRVEASAADLRDFRAAIRYWKYDSVLDRNEERLGEVLYEVKPGGGRRFAILLEYLIVGDRELDRPKHYVFDGTWLAEIDQRNKQFIKRQVVPPGSDFDPLKLGEGPFPMPVGQPADEVRARFDVTLRDVPQDPTLKTHLQGRRVEGVRLVPKATASEARDFRDVEIFYDHDTLIPVGICAVETNGDRRTVVLSEPKRNLGIDESLLSIEVPDKAGWQIDVQPWRE